MTWLIIGGALVLIAGWGIWLALREARNRGAAEQRAGDQADARAAEQEMTDIVLAPSSPADTKDKLKKGQF